MLIVLDNCEHLIEEIASLASELLSACSRLKILATSRESLRVPGEWLYPLPALEHPTENSHVDLRECFLTQFVANFNIRRILAM
jgi:predicted ATPase